MANMNPLADLHDIHLPSAVSAWPPGPAYYACLAILIILLLLYLKKLQLKKQTAPKREALTRLNTIKMDYLAHHNAKESAAAVNALLKQLALLYYPRIDVASLHGEAWITFLETHSKQIDFKSVENSLLNTPFNPHAKEDLTPLLDAANAWIQQRSQRCSN